MHAHTLTKKAGMKRNYETNKKKGVEEGGGSGRLGKCKRNIFRGRCFDRCRTNPRELPLLRSDAFLVDLHSRLHVLFMTTQSTLSREDATLSLGCMHAPFTSFKRLPSSQSVHVHANITQSMSYTYIHIQSATVHTHTLQSVSALLKM